jgi:hypothetical protein
MARSASAPIDKPFGAVRKVVKTAKSLLARRAECGNEYEASQNEQKALQEAYDDFQEQRSIMAAVADDLKVLDYKDAEFGFQEFDGAPIRRHAVGIRDCYFAWASPKGRLTFSSQLRMGHEWVLHDFALLEKALEKARKWLMAREAAARKRRERPGIALTAKDEAILRALAKDAPTTMTQEDLADVTRLSVRTVRARLKFMRGKKFVCRPLGSKKGETITDLGRQLIAARE